MGISKDILGLAAEFAVASELCRRNIYAQLTLGFRKRTDILVETEKGMLRFKLKANKGENGLVAREYTAKILFLFL